jgi:hypothetical protein
VGLFRPGIASGDFAAAAKSLAIKIHGAAAMAILVLIGTLLTAHARFAWRAGRNRINGAIILGAFAILIVPATDFIMQAANGCAHGQAGSIRGGAGLANFVTDPHLARETVATNCAAAEQTTIDGFC